MICISENTFETAPPSPTHLLTQTAEIGEEYQGSDEGLCCFCGASDAGVHVDDSTSKKYFSDDPLLRCPDSDHVCAACAYWRLVENHGWDCRVLGIRAAESAQRRDRFTGVPPTDHDGQDSAAAPIHHLTTADIWTYIVKHDLPYHEIYDEQGQLHGGIDAPENRLVTLYDAEFDSLGAREISQFVYPGETNALKEIEQEDE